MQRESLQQSSGLESRFLQELGLVRQDVEDRIRGSTEQLSNALGQLENYTLRGNEGITTTLCLKLVFKDAFLMHGYDTTDYNYID